MSEITDRIEKETLDALALRLTAGEIVMRNALEGLRREKAFAEFNKATEKIAAEKLKQMTRKCICCGAPWYEVDH